MTKARTHGDSKARRGTSATLLAVVAGAVLALAGCGERGAPVRDTPGPRIVSLSPAISRALDDLGLADRVVGRTPFCSAIDDAVPVVGDQQTVDYERLIRVRPTHVLVQPPLAGLDPELERLAGARRWSLAQWHLDDLDDVERLVRTLPEFVLAPDDPRRGAVLGRAAALAAAFTEARAARPTGWAGRTLLLCHLDPPMIFGRGTYLDDLLVAYGAVNASDARDWATLSLEDVVRLDPEAIVLVRGDGATTPAPAPLPAPYDALPVRAVRDGRTAIVARADALLPSTGLLDVADDLRRVLASFNGTPRP